MALLRGQWDEVTYWLIHSGSGRRGWGQQRGPVFGPGDGWGGCAA